VSRAHNLLHLEWEQQARTYGLCIDRCLRRGSLGASPLIYTECRTIPVSGQKAEQILRTLNQILRTLNQILRPVLQAKIKTKTKPRPRPGTTRGRAGASGSREQERGRTPTVRGDFLRVMVYVFAYLSSLRLEVKTGAMKGGSNFQVRVR
jgi:hypothetical protein